MRIKLSRPTWKHLLAVCFCLVAVFSVPPQPVRAQQDGTTPSYFDTVRLLEQSTFGHHPLWVDYVLALGFEAFLDDQLAQEPSNYPVLDFWPINRPAAACPTNSVCHTTNYTMYPLQTHFFNNALYGSDQLRQRAAFALGQIIVTAGLPPTNLTAWNRQYQQLLYAGSSSNPYGALGNFRQILYDITLNPNMGRYLDTQGNRCQTCVPATDPRCPAPIDPLTICRVGLAVKPNENFAREILQLFSVGTYLLNQDGTRVLDGSGNPVFTYTQEDIEEFSRVFTGWVFAPQLPGPPGVGGLVPNYRDPMVQFRDAMMRETWHDKGSKQLLNGLVLPGQQTMVEELDAAIDNLAYHDNVGPYIGKQLISHFATNNPSPGYVARISQVWRDNRQSPTQLFQVIKAILLDPEVRGDTRTEPDYGKLKEPILYVTHFLRAFDAISDGVLSADGCVAGTPAACPNLANENVTLQVPQAPGNTPIGTADMGQNLFKSPSVFNYYPFDYEIVGSSPVLLGPVFQIYDTVAALRRANWLNRMVFSNIPALTGSRPIGTFIDWNTVDPSLAADPAFLVYAFDWYLTQATLTDEQRQFITDAVSAIPETNPLLRIRQAAYLVASSAQYNVER